MTRRRTRDSPPLGERFQRALTLAARLHAAQVRRGSDVPYLGHVLGVCARIIEDGGTEDEAIAALLHDALEHQARGGKTAREIEKEFGPRVLEIVTACTDAPTHPPQPWLERKRRYAARARTHDPAARRVSLADKIDNVRSLLRALDQEGDVAWNRYPAAPAPVVGYYRRLAEVYGDATTDGLWREFVDLVDRLDARLDQAPRR